MISTAFAVPTLPPGWSEGKTRAQIRRALFVESIPNEELVARLAQPTRHAKGYIRLFLGKGHPYANSGGHQFLHRYIKMRAERRVLPPAEHVHHRAVACDLKTRRAVHAPKDTTDPELLDIMLDTEHGHYHWFWHGPCKCRPLEELEQEAEAYAARFPAVGGAF